MKIHFKLFFLHLLLRLIIVGNMNVKLEKNATRIMTKDI